MKASRLGRVVQFLGVLVFVALLSASCTTKRAIERSPLFPLSENAILDQIEQNEFSFETLSAKLSVSASSPDQNGSFKVNMRMKSDSIIWMSITPALGIEAARLIIDPDSLKFIDKLKNEYSRGSYNSIDSVMRYSTEFSFIQNLLTGNAVEIEPDEKYTSIVDNLYYVLQTKVKRKLKKSVDVAIKPSKRDTVTAYGDITKKKKFDKASEKFDDIDLIIKRYYIRAEDFRIARINIDDLLYKRSVQIDYNNFEIVNGVPFPLDVDIEVRTPSEKSKFELRYSRIKVNEDQSYPFRIPSSYSPM